MSSAVPQFSLVLIRRLADGADEWIDVSVPQRMETAPGGSYALIDRGAGYEAPESLTASRAGDDLVVAVGETQVLVLGGFFAVTGAEFYPTTNIAGGAGPFSGAPVTPETEVAAVVGDTQLVWSAEPVSADVAAAPIATGSAGGSNTGLILGGLAVGGLGLAAVGGGGGGGGGTSVVGSSDGTSTVGGSDDTSTAGGSDDTSTAGDSGSTAPADTVPPQITSAPEAAAVNENSGAGQVVYTATATDANSVRWSLSSAGDAASFSINPTSGAVTLTEDPDFETQSSYSFTVVATDSANNSSQQTVLLAINDLDESAPVITSGDTAPAIDENSGAGQIVYTATATDEETFSWTLADSDDGSAFTIDASSGAVTLVEDPDFEAQRDFTFTVVATDAAGNASQQAVSLTITDLDEEAPVIVALDPADGATDVAVDRDIVLTFSEDVALGVGEIVIRSESDSRTIDVSDDSRISVDGNEVTVDPGSDLLANSRYSVQIDEGAVTDLTGNSFAGITDDRAFDFVTEDGADISIVVFDLVEGASSDHSDRTFDSDISYDIYIRVESDDSDLRLPGRERWEGAANLGSDDRIILVGDGQAVSGPIGNVNRIAVSASEVAWLTGFGLAAGELQDGSFARNTGFGGNDNEEARLFETRLPSSFLSNQGGALSTMYLTDMPPGVLTSQGLI